MITTKAKLTTTCDSLVLYLITPSHAKLYKIPYLIAVQNKKEKNISKQPPQTHRE